MNQPVKNNQTITTIPKKGKGKKVINPPTIVKEKMSVLPEMMGLLVGRNASNLDRLRQKYGVKISRPDWGNFHINIEGPVEMVSVAKKDIEDSLPRTINFVIEKKHIGLVIGTKGETITDLRRTNQVKINVGEEGNVKCFNPREQERMWISKDVYRSLAGKQ